MLVLTRCPGEWVRIELHNDVPAEMTVGELFAQGPIRVILVAVHGNRARVGVLAPPALRILRSELESKPRR